MAGTVLIVDDSLTVRMDLHEAFTGGGFRTLLCATGAQAQAAFDAEEFDVAVLDVRLPDADGVELLRLLRADPRHADVVALLLTSEADVRERLRGLRTGADEYVGKPYDAQTVVARSRELLQRGEPPAAVTVLVIDDSLTFREELRERLGEAGYEVLLAGSGEEGLRLAAARPPSAIVVDGVLPGIDGATVIRRARLDAALRNVPCLLLTASDDYATELQIFDAGADAFVRKREDLAVLLAKLAAVLRRSASPLPVLEGTYGQVTVLLVDADRVFVEQVSALLREDGYEPVPAHDADDALALLAVQPPGCVVLALDLPGVDGAALCERIRAVPGLRDMPIVGVGAGGGRLLDCLAAGADDYVLRADGAGTLHAHIRAHIRRQHLHDESRRIREALLRRELEAADERAARQVAEARAELVEELQWRNRELEAFSGSVSHDLRSPLQTILSFSEMLLEDEGLPLPDVAARIHNAAKRMQALIDALLQLAGANRGDLRRSPVDMSALAGEVFEELRQRDPDRDVAVQVAAGMRASGDGELLRVVLVNLLGNAWKFTGRTAHARIEVSYAAGTFTVRDNGAGFPSDKADELFRPFGRLHSSAEFPGTGIGLTTVQRVVERHGGRVWADSEPGKGATFSFTLAGQDLG